MTRLASQSSIERNKYNQENMYQMLAFLSLDMLARMQASVKPSYDPAALFPVRLIAYDRRYAAVRALGIAFYVLLCAGSILG